jgi:biotin carboxyl carrier protein
MTKKVTVIVEGKEYIVEVGDLSEGTVKATVNKKTYNVEVPDKKPEPSTSAPAAPKPRQPKPAAPPTKASPGAGPADAGNVITAPMPGDILEVRVQEGDIVNPGEVVCVLEAMKMKNMIRSATGGKVASVEVSAGQAVEYNAVLITFE